MRKFVLALVIALTGVIGTSPLTTQANGARTVTVTDNDTRSVSIEITRDETHALYILVCAVGATECSIANAENSTKVLRFDCYYKDGVHVTPHPCRNYNDTAGNHEVRPSNAEFQEWRANYPRNNGLLLADTYNIKIYESATGSVNSYTEVTTRQISFPQFSYNYDVEPIIQGESLVGQTLSFKAPTWRPTANDVSMTWFRCKKATPKIEDAYQIKAVDFPFSWGYKFDLNADCAVLTESGQLADPPVSNVPLSFLSTQSIRTQATTGFTSYKITTNDLGYYITVRFDLDGMREFWTAPAAVIEQKTAPISQVAPASSFTKTKKIKKLTVGAQVTATTGTWKWANTTTYQWFACTKRQKSTASINTKQCKSIKRATKANYKVKKADKGRFLVAQVTATNELGSTVIYATSLKKVE